MNEMEYDIINELYFLMSYKELEVNLSLNEEELVPELKSLIQKGWVKCLMPQTEEIISDLGEFDKKFRHYNYLATKEGLLMHNSK